ncbi:MAG: hypothetical protein ACRD0U_18985 [Acidimicrobiales bacterium]
MDHGDGDELETLFELRELSVDQLRKRLGFSRSAVMAGADYGPSDDLVLVYDEDVHPGLFFYDSDGRFLLVYAGTLDGMTPADLVDRYGEPDARLRSRAGKHFGHRVFAGAGVAASWERGSDELAVVEVFRPMTVAEYKERIYEEPSRFTE